MIFSTFGTSEVISYAVGVGVGVGGMAGQGVTAGIVSGLLALCAFLGLQLLEHLARRAFLVWQRRRIKHLKQAQQEQVAYSPIGRRIPTGRDTETPRASPLAHTAPDKLEPEDEEEQDRSKREKRTFWS